MPDDKIRKMVGRLNDSAHDVMCECVCRDVNDKMERILREELEPLLKAAQEAAELPGERGDRLSGVHTTALSKLAEVLKDFGR